LGLVAVVVSTPFERFEVSVERRGPPPDGEQLGSVLRAVGDLRFGVEMRDPGALRAARELMQLLDGGGSGFGRDSTRLDDAADGVGRANGLADNELRDISRRLEEELLAGRLVVKREQIAPLTDRREPLELQLPPLPPVRRDSGTHTFEVRFIDEVGKAISGIDAEFTADGAQTRPTNAAGIALLEGVRAGSASVAILDPEALAKVLDPRWEKFRPGKPPKESNTQEVVFRGSELGPFALKPEIPNTVIIKPPLGKLFVELWDKTGRVRHAKQAFQVMGPQEFAGKTNEQGVALIENVFPGDYALSFPLEHAEPQRLIDIIETPLLVLDAAAQAPQVRFVGAIRRLLLARLKRMFFETNKSFLLPGAVGAFKQVRELYRTNNPSDLLIVGHTDTTAEPAVNDPLSLERADMTAAYLLDDVDAWLERYDEAVPAKRRWTQHEDELMLSALPDFATRPAEEGDVHWFQRTRGLVVDGKSGPKTRRQLISEYMALDGASLRDRRNFDISVTTHGCGENFPLDDGGEELDDVPADQKEDASDRRVELFFFDAELGILPPPPGKNSPAGSTQYPEWRKRATRVVDLESSFIEGLIVEWSTDIDSFVPDDLVLEARQEGKTQRLAWTDGIVDGPVRRFIYRKILGPTPVTLTAMSEAQALELVLWRDQVVTDELTPPTWESLLEDSFGLLQSQPDETIDSAEELIDVSDVASYAVLPEQFV
jgi:hypothetical protein